MFLLSMNEEADLPEASGEPVAAVLTYRDGSRKLRGNRDNFIDLLRTAKEEGVTAYVVAHDDLDVDASSVRGYVYNDAKKQWALTERPFPHVVYNRIPYRKFEQLPEVQELIDKCLRHPRIRFFNPSFFSKWSLFQWLDDSPHTRDYVPETIKLGGFAEFASLLRAHKIVYLKPAKGKAGKGIMKVQRLPGKARAAMYRLTVQSGEGTETTRCDSAAKLYAAVKAKTGGQEYVAQQGIELVHAGGRPFDLRALVQKNSKGQWRVSGVGARVAGASSITTHVPRGGSIDDPEKLLAATFGVATGRAILRNAKAAAIALAAQIEKGSGHNLGEMSMDLGVDKTGKLWFFEANSKPMKFDEPHIRRVSLRRLVRYWKFLVRHPSESAPRARKQANTKRHGRSARRNGGEKRRDG